MIRVLMAACLFAAMATNSCPADERPNVILIMADDVSWECFGCYGAEDYETPNLDALAADGIRFSNCFSTPICTPSRVKIMTGQYSFRNYTHFGYLHPQDKTFGHLMQAAGYRTAIAGKWQLNGLYHGAPRNQDKNRPYEAGFHEYCLWQLTTVKGGELGGERFWSPPLEHNGQFLTKEDNHEKYGPDIMSDFICDFIDRNHEKPFFVYYPSVLVHDPFVPTPDSIGDRAKTHEMNNGPKSKGEQKENFVAMVKYLDKLVGKIVRKVDEVGELENTIILFTADNGTNTRISSRWDGRAIQGGKGGTTDMGTHVPFIAYWKNHAPSGVVYEDLVDFTDFYATLAEVAGVQLRHNDPRDGRSFFPRLSGQPGNPRDWVLCHYQPYWGRFEGKQFTRNENFKLYRDGRFYFIPTDLKEERDLQDQRLDAQASGAKQYLQSVLNIAPPAPPKQGGRDAKERPIHATWKHLADPND